MGMRVSRGVGQRPWPQPGHAVAISSSRSTPHYTSLHLILMHRRGCAPPVSACRGTSTSSLEHLRQCPAPTAPGLSFRLPTILLGRPPSPVCRLIRSSGSINMFHSNWAESNSLSQIAICTTDSTAQHTSHLILSQCGAARARPYLFAISTRRPNRRQAANKPCANG